MLGDLFEFSFDLLALGVRNGEGTKLKESRTLDEQLSVF